MYRVQDKSFAPSLLLPLYYYQQKTQSVFTACPTKPHSDFKPAHPTKCSLSPASLAQKASHTFPPHSLKTTRLDLFIKAFSRSPNLANLDEQFHLNIRCYSYLLSEVSAARDIRHLSLSFSLSPASSTRVLTKHTFNTETSRTTQHHHRHHKHQRQQQVRNPFCNKALLIESIGQLHECSR